LTDYLISVRLGEIAANSNSCYLRPPLCSSNCVHIFFRR